MSRGEPVERRRFPGFDDVSYLLRGRPLAFHADIDMPSWRKSQALTRGEYRPRRALELRWAMGRARPSDFVFTTMFAPIIVHERVLSIFEAHSFRGWRTYPVTVFDKHGARARGYHGLAITGRCGHVHKRAKKRVMKRYPAGWFPVGRGLGFDAKPWDGSDLFMSSSGEGFVFVLSGVRRALEKARATNLRFHSLAEFEIMVR